METNDIRSEVITADGSRHTVHVHRRGNMWTASGSAGGEFDPGAGADGPLVAIDNWKRAYEQMRAKEN